MHVAAASAAIMLAVLALAGQASADEGGQGGAPASPPAAESQPSSTAESQPNTVSAPADPPAQAPATTEAASQDNAAASAPNDGSSNTAGAGGSDPNPSAAAAPAGAEQPASTPAADAPQVAAAAAPTTQGSGNDEGQGSGGQAQEANGQAQATNGQAPDSGAQAQSGAGQGENGGGAPESSTSAGVTQDVGTSSSATQEGASNTHETNASGAPQDGGSVAQGNGVGADATTSATASVAQQQADPPTGASQGAGDGGGGPDGQASGNTAGQASGPGNGPVGAAGGNQATEQNPATATVAQNVSANADSTQNGANNTNLTIRNDAPGADGAVGQTNTASADATASAGANTGAGAGGGASAAQGGENGSAAQQAQASATATQNDAANTNVSVRVGSPGASGGVSQSNSSSANAAATANGPDGQTTATSHAEQNGVENTNVSVRVLSPGDDGPVDQRNVANAQASGGAPNAQADQEEARNTNVSIRVASSGTNGQVSQSSNTQTKETSGVSADNSTIETLDVVNSDGNTSVLIAVDGPDLADPTAGAAGLVTIWRWNWEWAYDGVAPVPQTLGDWAVTTVAPTPDLAVGSFQWNWTWQRPGEWTWPWQPSQTVDCTCIWIWDWKWVWGEVGSPPAAPAAPQAAEAPSEAPASVSQENVVSASAEASATVEIAQSTADDGTLTGFAGQIATVSQVVDGVAVAVQSGARNELDGVVGRQVNRTVADSRAASVAAASQAIVQGTAGTGSTTQWAGQQVVFTQEIGADAEARQTRVGHVGDSGDTIAVADANAIALAVASQGIVQLGASLGGLQDQWAGQLVGAVQIGLGRARAAQYDVYDNALALAMSISTTESQTVQFVGQVASGDAGVRSQQSSQQAMIGQLADAEAITEDGVVGPPRELAVSLAVAQDESLLAQLVVQELAGTGGIDVQASWQNAFVIQVAHARANNAVDCSSAAVAYIREYTEYCAPPPQPGATQTPGTDPVQNPSVAEASVAEALARIGRLAPIALTGALAPDVRLVGHGKWTATPGKLVTSAGSDLQAARPPAPHGVEAPPAQPAVAGDSAGVLQISAPTASAPPSGPSSTGAGKHGHEEPPLQWPWSGLVSGAASASPFASGGSGVAAAMAAFLLALLGGWWVIAGSAVRRPTIFSLRLETPG
jgi:hypothetical protein